MSDVNEYYGMALWYAWGRLDGREYSPRFRAKLDAFEFANFVKEKRQEFVDTIATGKGGAFKSIQGLWAEYVESKDN